MSARLNHAAPLVSDAMQALSTLGKFLNNSPVSAQTLYLVCLRTSQMNGCQLWLDMHSEAFNDAGVIDAPHNTVATWRDASHFNAAERAALALTEIIGQHRDQADPTVDTVWHEASQHYSEPELAALVIAIAMVNFWNSLNAKSKTTESAPRPVAA